MRKSSTARRQRAFAKAAGLAALMAVGMTIGNGSAAAIAAEVKPVAQNGDRTVIAHRGASSYLPEHSLAAYAMAYAQGTDYIEPDVVLTKDDVPLCVHDLYLETTTDVAARFPERKRADGHYYAADFTLDEVRTLKLFGRAPEAERAGIQGYQVVTLEELILLVQHLNRKTGRSVGLLVETKGAEFHVKEGRPLEKPLLDVLAKHGYTKPDSGTIIQSFDGAHLKRLRQEHGTELPLMWLTGGLPTPEALDELATWANGWNPSRLAIVSSGKIADGAADLLKHAKARGLKVFVWTFNAEDEAMHTFLYDFGVDGVITNNPDFGVKAVKAKQ